MKRKDKIQLAVIYGVAVLLIVVGYIAYSMYMNSGPKAGATGTHKQGHSQCQYPDRTTNKKQAIPGDLNHDGTVNQADLDIVLAHFDTTDPEGDVNADGVTDLLDLSILLSHWGQSNRCDNSDPCDAHNAVKGGSGDCEQPGPCAGYPGGKCESCTTPESCAGHKDQTDLPDPDRDYYDVDGNKHDYRGDVIEPAPVTDSVDQSQISWGK